MSTSRVSTLERVLHTALVLVVGVLLTVVVRERPVGSGRTVAEADAQTPSEEPAPQPLGSALIDAVPWARVERIEGPSGELRPVPRPAETPLVLELPEGSWRVVLSDPQREEELTCDLEISVGFRSECRVEFERLTVDQYFRDAGWWR